LAQLYARLQALPRVLEPAQLALDTSQKPESVAWGDNPVTVVGLEELAVVSSITNRWPLWLDTYAADEGAPVEEVEEDAFLDDFDEAAPPPARRNESPGAALESPGQDETDEMDVVAKSNRAEE
jgi:hypothetical protein